MTATPPNAPLKSKSNEEIAELCAKYRAGDQQALTALFYQFRALAVKYAKRWHRYPGIEFDDLFQEASIGIMNAARRYELSHGPFIPFVIFYMRSAMHHHVRREISIVKIASGEQLKERGLHGDISLNSNSTAQQGGVRQNPTKRAHGTNRLLQNPEALLDTVPDEQPSPEEQVIEANELFYRQQLLDEAIESLQPRSAWVIRNYTLKKQDHVTGPIMDDIAQKLGVSKERVRQIEERALQDIKQFFADLGVAHENEG